MNKIKPHIVQKEVTLHILKKFGIHMSKKLGQNFLIDQNVLDDIVDTAQIKAGDTVLEIGPGVGTLTRRLAETGASVIAVEIDFRLIEVLQKTLAGCDNVKILHGDILKIDLSQEISSKKYKVVANLPYYITTPILMKFFEEKMPAELLITMVQKEVAERITASPGGKDYGVLSVAAQYYAETEIMFSVPAAAFLPTPKVESAVLRCVVRSTAPVSLINEKTFFQVVRAAFGQRRKTLSNALKITGLDKGGIKIILDQAGIDGLRRGEQLSLAEFAKIADAWENLKGK
jgi:16S rRNA (adenine1518-N6/adenine1519-N6)-dimethyltransferase